MLRAIVGYIPYSSYNEHRGAHQGVWVVLGKGLPSQSPMARQTQIFALAASGTRRRGYWRGAHVAATHKSFDAFVKPLIVCQSKRDGTDSLDTMMPAAALRFLPASAPLRDHRPNENCDRRLWTFTPCTRRPGTVISIKDDTQTLSIEAMM